MRIQTEHESKLLGDDHRISLAGQVAIVTGAGHGLGRSHALHLAARGAAVLVNDTGTVLAHTGETLSLAEQVAVEIRNAGGQALSSMASIIDAHAVAHMTDRAMEAWGRIDILVNNAGFVRDETFSNMRIDDFQAVINVHLMGAVHCTKAVWEIMKHQRYGRVVMTTSSSGLFGQFGQTNHGAAKMALVGLMQSLAIEGEPYGIRVNCLAPTVAAGMSQAMSTVEQRALFVPESVSPGLVYLVSRHAPTKTILCAGGGAFSCSNVTLTDGVFLGTHGDTADRLAERVAMLVDREGERVPAYAMDQAAIESGAARYALQ